MFFWLGYWKYRHNVLAEAMTILFHPNNNLIKFLRLRFPGLFKVIQNGYREHTEFREIAVLISSAVLVSLIDSLDNERRKTILNELASWAKTPFALETFSMKSDLETTPDAFISRLKWAIHYLLKCHNETGLSQYYVDYINGEIFGSLAGRSREERSANRIDLFLSDACGASGS